MSEFKRPNGSVVRIDVELVCTLFYEPRWDHRVWERKKFKHDFSIMPEAATDDEIHEAKLAYWESLKPKSPKEAASPQLNL